MKTQTPRHTPTLWKISQVIGGNQWVVGKGNSLTELFYFNHLGDAVNKYRELVGDAFIVRAVNEYEKNQKTIEALMQFKDSMSFALRCFNEKYKPEDIFAAMRGHLEMVENAIAQASEGK